MFDRSLNLLTATATIALLPLAVPAFKANHSQVAISLSAQPVAIGVQIATRPLDLARLSPADFGDSEVIR